MSLTFSKVARRGLLVLCSLVLLGVVAPFIIEFVQRLGGNHYPGTAQEAGVVALLANGKQIAMAVDNFRQDQGSWPTTLAEVIQEGLLTNKQVCSYPNINDLPDIRDIRKMNDFGEWLYIKPQDDSQNLPMIVAPRPYTGSMGRQLPKPRRIVVDRTTIADSVEEEKIAPTLRQIFGK